MFSPFTYTDKTFYIATLTPQVQRLIKSKVKTALIGLGIERALLGRFIESAMSGRICDLEDLVSIEILMQSIRNIENKRLDNTTVMW